MKKIVSFVIVCGMFFVNASALLAQEAASSGGGLSEFHNALKEKFVQGGVPWMTPILILLIIGLAIAIERIIYLNMATTNTDKLLKKVEDALETGGVEAAKEVCRTTRGPVASIFYQGFERYEEGIDMVEKSIVSYGGVQMGKLENGMVWLQLFIALAPSLGFLGTVVGMVQAFDDIAKAGDISPTIVAEGMMVALLTTIFGLIVAMILQVFYNYLLNKISSLVNNMEDSSISIMDILMKYKAAGTSPCENPTKN
ncbi:MAG: MotA/TolQ/ExbB proton channel family protein [Bacteroidales bacterium]|jgi:biopolymer transport protein ExbB|nr:MotA/TolQ/ExbB proton channel family protein [Bacteroidales bacterium]